MRMFRIISEGKKANCDISPKITISAKTLIFLCCLQSKQTNYRNRYKNFLAILCNGIEDIMHLFNPLNTSFAFI